MYTYVPPQQFHSESNVQAEFYHQCRLIELPCTLELQTAVGRPDCAIFDDTWTRLLAIVEVKKRDRFSMRQIGRYKRLGVPVYGLHDATRAARLAAQLKRDSAALKGVDIEVILAMPKNPYLRRRKLRQEFSPMNLCDEIIYRS